MFWKAGKSCLLPGACYRALNSSLAIIWITATTLKTGNRHLYFPGNWQPVPGNNSCISLSNYHIELCRSSKKQIGKYYSSNNSR